MNLRRQLVNGIIQGLLLFSVGAFFWIIADSPSALGLGIASFFIGILIELEDDHEDQK